MPLCAYGLGQFIQQFLQNSSDTRRLEFNAGQAIHEPTDPADTFYFIESGEIRLFHVNGTETPRLLEIMGAGEWLGAAPLAKLPAWGKRAVAAAPSVLHALPIQTLRDHLQQDGELALEILQGAALRLQQSWTQGSQLVSEDCRLRLIKTLLRFSTTPAAQSVPEGVVLKITHAQLAQAVGAARETVSICLTELRHRNLIKTGRNQLSFDPRQLRELDVV